MRTLQLGEGWFPEHASGLNQVFYNLMAHLPGVGVEARGLVAGPPDLAARTGGQVAAFAAPDAPLATRWRHARRAVRGVLAEDAPALVAAHFALYAAPVVRRLGETPLVVHFHGPWADESRVEGAGRLAAGLKHRLERSVYRRAARCIVLSGAFRDVLHQRYAVPAERIRVVPGGVDAARFAIAEPPRAARERLGWDPDRPTVLAVRRLRRRMGLEDLIEAMDTVRQAVPEALLLVAGSGPLAPDLQARIDAAGLGAHVRLLGFVPDADLPLAYRAADLTVVPTVALEGFGLITLESLAAGTPVLVTPVGGLPEAVRGLTPAMVLPAPGPAALADGIAAALHGALPLPDADACRRYAAEQFGWPVIARRIRAVYDEACR